MQSARNRDYDGSSRKSTVDLEWFLKYTELHWRNYTETYRVLYSYYYDHRQRLTLQCNAGEPPL